MVFPLKLLSILISKHIVLIVNVIVYGLTKECSIDGLILHITRYVEGPYTSIELTYLVKVSMIKNDWVFREHQINNVCSMISKFRLLSP